MLGLASALKVLDRVRSSHVLVDGRLCSRLKWHRSNCRLCQGACAAGAIDLGEDVGVREENCTACGVCIAACPNGVFWSQSKSDGHLAKEMASALSGGRKSLWIGCRWCQGGDAGPKVVLSCLGRLTESLLLAPFVLGVETLYLLKPDCQGCANEAGAGHLEKTLSLSRELLRLVGLTDQAIQEIAITRNLAPSVTATPSVTTRRGLFRLARLEATLAGAALLPSEGAISGKQPAARPLNRKRAYLLRLLRNFKTSSISMPAPGFPAGAVEIGAGCVGCNVCETLCPMGALRRVQDEGRLSIRFRGQLCTGCGICQEACLFKAAALNERFPPEALLLESEAELACLEQQDCHRCGQVFWASTPGHCPACRVQAGGDLRIRSRFDTDL